MNIVFLKIRLVFLILVCLLTYSSAMEIDNRPAAKVSDFTEGSNINPQYFAVAAQQEEERQHDLANPNYNLAFNNQDDKDFRSSSNEKYQDNLIINRENAMNQLNLDNRAEAPSTLEKISEYALKVGTKEFLKIFPGGRIFSNIYIAYSRTEKDYEKGNGTIARRLGNNIKGIIEFFPGGQKIGEAAQILKAPGTDTLAETMITCIIPAAKIRTEGRPEEVAGSIAKNTIILCVPYGTTITSIAGWIGSSLFGTETLTEGLFKVSLNGIYGRETREREDNSAPSSELIIETYPDSYKEMSNTNVSILAFSSPLRNINKGNIVPGRYIIKNYALGVDRDPHVGGLSWTVASPSGYYAQVLNDTSSSYYLTDKDKYLPQGSYRNSIVWEISQAEDGAYTLKNCGLEGGLLSWADVSWLSSKTYSGYYAQVLANNQSYGSNYYPSEKDFYLPGGKYRNDVLWEIFPSEKEGKYHIRNIGSKFKNADVGFLCWTQKESKSGYYAQVLEGGHYDKYKIKYRPEGEYRDSIIWELSLIKN